MSLIVCPLPGDTIAVSIVLLVGDIIAFPPLATPVARPSALPADTICLLDSLVPLDKRSGLDKQYAPLITEKRIL